MKRSLGVIIIGILSMLGSLFVLMAGVLAVVGWKMSPPQDASNPLIHTAMKWALTVGLIFCFGLAVWGISTSIGIFRLRNWARLSILVFSVLLALFGFLFAVVMAAMPFPAPHGQPMGPAFIGHLRLAMIAYYLLLAALGVWWLIFFNRRSVKQQFAASVGANPNPNSRRPLSITVIACYCLVSAAFMVPGSSLLCSPGRRLLRYFSHTPQFLSIWESVSCALTPRRES